MNPHPTPGVYVDEPATAPVGVLVCVPGVNSGPYIFEGARALADRWRVVRLTTPGADGVPMPLPFTVKAYAQMVAKVIESQRIDGVPLVLLGHSLGGYAAQEVARVLGHGVDRLILVSTSRGQPDTARDVMQMQSKLGQNFWAFGQEVAKDAPTAMKPLFGEHFVVHEAARYHAFLAERARHVPPASASAAQLAAGGAFSSRGWVHTLSLPTLVVHGLDDILVTPESGQALAASLPHGHWLPLQGIGHHPPVEHDRFWDYVRRFAEGQDLGEPVLPKPNLWARMKDFLGRSG